MIGEGDKLDITVCSQASAARFARLCQNVDFSCPVLNLIKAAGVDMKVTWTQVLPCPGKT